MSESNDLMQKKQTNFQKFTKEVKHRMFTANLHMIRGFKLHPVIFFIFQLIQYLQLIFFAFYNINIEDSSLNWDSSNSILSLIFMNYQNLFMDEQYASSLTTFQLALYLHLAYFIFLLIYSLLVSGKQGCVRETDIRDTILALGVYFGQSFLVIPTFQLYITTFNCEKLESLDSNFICNKQQHIILMIISSILIILVLGFLFCEALLFQNPDIKSKLPWRQIPSRISQIKLLIQISTVLFNFNTLNKVPVAAGAFFLLNAFLLFKRYYQLRLYWKPYLIWTLFSETSLFWFSSWTLICKITNAPLTLFSLILLIAVAIPWFMFFYNFSFKKRYDLNQMSSSIVDPDLYFGHLLDLIKASKNNDKKSKVLLFGLIRTHWYQCKKRGCLCQTLIKKIDGIQKVIDEKQSHLSDAFDMLFQQQQEIGLLEEKMEKQIAQEEKAHLEIEHQMALDRAQINVNNIDKQMQNIVQSCSAAAAGDIITLERLKNQGADMNLGDYDNRTPLHLASATGQLKAVQFLIEKAQVKISPTDRWGATPLNDSKSQELTQYLLSQGGQFGVPQKEYQEMIHANVNDDQCRLYFAAFNGDLQLMINLFFLGNCKINDYDYDGRSALSIAASEGHIDSVKFLVVNGADTTHKDARNNTPLDDAKREKRQAVIQFLEKVNRSRKNLQYFLQSVQYEDGGLVDLIVPGKQVQLSPTKTKGLLAQHERNYKEKIQERKSRQINKKISLNIINYKKEIQLLLYRFVFSLLEDIVVQQQSISLRYLAAYIQYQYLKNDIKALFQILFIERESKVPFEWRFFLFKAKIELEERMASTQKLMRNEFKGESMIDVKRVYLFQKTLQDFVSLVDKTADNCLDFWRELLKKTDFNVNNFHRLGSLVTVQNQQITHLVNSMLEINPHYGYLLRTYSQFLSKVLNNTEEGELYSVKSENSEKTFLSQQRKGTPLTEDLSKNFSGEVNFLVITMKVATSGAEEGIGVIEDINQEVQSMLGYKRNELRGRQISKIMPKCIGNFHDQFVRRYLENAETRFLNKQREVFVLKKNGYMMQVYVYATVVPKIERDGLKFIGFIKRVDERVQTKVLSPPVEFQNSKSIIILASPNGNIMGINEMAYKILGLPHYAAGEDDYENNEFNLQNMIEKYDEVIFKCIKHSPTGQVAIIDTDLCRQNLDFEQHTPSELKKIERRIGRYQVHIQVTPVEYGGSYEEMVRKETSYLPLVIYRMYVIARLQKVTKAFLRKEVQFNSSHKSNGSNDQAKQNNQLIRNNSSHLGVPSQKTKSQQIFQRSLAKLIGFQFLKKVTIRKKNNNVDQRELSINENSDEEEKEDSFVEDIEDIQLDESGEENNDVEFEIKLPLGRFGTQNWQNQASKKSRLNSTDKTENKTFTPNEGSQTASDSLSQQNKMNQAEVESIIKFRRQINSKDDPLTVIFLRRFVYVITAIIVALVSVQTALKFNFSKSYIQFSQMRSAMENIQIDIIHVASGFRNLINIQNNIMQDEISGLVSTGGFQLEILENMNNYLNSLNTNKNMFFTSNILPSSVFDMAQNVSMNIVQSDGNFQTQMGNLNLALSQVVSKGSDLLRVCKVEQNPFRSRTFIEYINTLAPSNITYKYGGLGNTIDDITKNLYYLEENLFDSFTSICSDLQEEIFSQMNNYIKTQEIIALVLLSSALLIALISSFAILRLLRQTEQRRLESLSLYSELQIEEVQEVIAELSKFINDFRESSCDNGYQKHGINETSEEELDDTSQLDLFQIIQEEPQSSNNIPLMEGTFQFQTDLISSIGSTVSQGFNQQQYQNFQFQRQATQKPMSKKDKEKKNKGLSSKKNDNPTIEEENSELDQYSHSSNNSYAQSSIHEIQILNEPDLSQRNLAPSMGEIQRSKKAPEIDQETVSNKEKFKEVASNSSSFKQFTAVALLLIFPVTFFVGEIVISLPLFSGMITLQNFEKLNSAQLLYDYEIYLQIMKDMVKGVSQPAFGVDIDGLIYYPTRSQQLNDLKFQAWQDMQNINYNHPSAINEAVNFVNSLDTNQYCFIINNALAQMNQTNFNLTFCETVDSGVALNQGFHIQMERILGQIQIIRNAFEKRPFNLTNVFYKLINQDQIMAKFQLLMDQLFTPTFKAMRWALDSELNAIINEENSIETIILAAFIVLHLTVVVVLGWPRFLKGMTKSISRSRGILTLIPSRLIIKNPSIKSKLLGNNNKFYLSS